MCVVWGGGCVGVCMWVGVCVLWEVFLTSYCLKYRNPDARTMEV